MIERDDSRSDMWHIGCQSHYVGRESCPFYRGTSTVVLLDGVGDQVGQWLSLYDCL